MVACVITVYFYYGITKSMYLLYLFENIILYLLKSLKNKNIINENVLLMNKSGWAMGMLSETLYIHIIIFLLCAY